MKARQIIASIMAIVGFLLMAGAVGDSDFYGYFSIGDFVRISVGLVLAIVAIPVSGELRKE